MKSAILPLLFGIGLALGQVPAAIAADAPAAAATALPGASLYHLQAGLTDQHGQSLQWASLRGKPQLVSMFYTSCHYVCPLIVDSGKAIEKTLTPAQQQRLEHAHFIDGRHQVVVPFLVELGSGLFGVGPDGRHSEHRGRRVAGRLVAEAAQEVHDCAG